VSTVVLRQWYSFLVMVIFRAGNLPNNKYVWISRTNAIADSFRTVRKNTIRIAEDIPETAYGYRPTPENRSVAETLGHIAIASRADLLLKGEKRLAGNLRFRGVDQAVLGSRRAPLSKSEILNLLRTEGERWCDWLASFRDAVLAEQVRMPGGALKEPRRVALGTKKHEMHYRAQLMVRNARWGSCLT